jgi:hypothetical protein
MKQIIPQIFRECNFQRSVNENETEFYHLETAGRSEYYILEFIQAGELQQYNANSAYNAMIERKEAFHDIEKNTSLILCVEFQQLADEYELFKNAMLKIEEDEYWFKKYLLPYTRAGVASINADIEIIPQLNATVLNENDFSAFRQNIFSVEHYFLAIQCFLKLPFLPFTPIISVDFVAIEQTLSNQLSSWDLTLLYEKITPFDNGAEGWETRKTQALTTNRTDFDQFLNNFFENVQP